MSRNQWQFFPVLGTQPKYIRHHRKYFANILPAYELRRIMKWLPNFLLWSSRRRKKELQMIENISDKMSWKSVMKREVFQRGLWWPAMYNVRWVEEWSRYSPSICSTSKLEVTWGQISQMLTKQEQGSHTAKKAQNWEFPRPWIP